MDIVELAAIRAVLGRAYADDPLSAWIFRRSVACSRRTSDVCRVE